MMNSERDLLHRVRAFDQRAAVEANLEEYCSCAFDWPDGWGDVAAIDIDQNW